MSSTMRKHVTLVDVRGTFAFIREAISSLDRGWSTRSREPSVDFFSQISLIGEFASLSPRAVCTSSFPSPLLSAMVDPRSQREQGPT